MQAATRVQKFEKFARKFDESKEADGQRGTEKRGRRTGKDEEVPAAVSLLSSVFMVIRAIPLTQE